MAAAKSTTDHETIRRWVEERGGHPARVKETGDGGDPGILRVDFPGFAEESLERISWEEWFDKFDDNNLTFLYQEEEVEAGEPSRFNKIVSRESAEASERRPTGEAGAEARH